MGSPVIFKGANASFLNNGGLEFKAGTTIEPYSGNPNGNISRTKGSLILDVSSGELYINTDGSTAWKKYSDLHSIEHTEELTGDGTTANPLGLSGLIEAAEFRYRTGASNDTTVLLSSSGYLSILPSTPYSTAYISPSNSYLNATTAHVGNLNTSRGFYYKEDAAGVVYSIGDITSTTDSNYTVYAFNASKKQKFIISNSDNEATVSLVQKFTLTADSTTLSITRASDANTTELASVSIGRSISLNSVDEYGTPLVSFYGTIQSGAYAGTTHEVYSFGRQEMVCPPSIQFKARELFSGYGVNAGSISTLEYKPKSITFGANFPSDSNDYTVKEGCVYGLYGISALTPEYRYDATPSSNVSHTWRSFTTNSVHEIVNKQADAPYIVCKHETDANRRVSIYNDRINVKTLSFTESEIFNLSSGQSYIRFYSNGNIGFSNVPQTTDPKIIVNNSSSIFYSLGEFNGDYFAFDTAYIGNNYNTGAATHTFYGVYTRIPFPDTKPTVLVVGNYNGSQPAANLVVATDTDSTPFESVGLYCDFNQFGESCYYFCKGIKYTGSSAYTISYGNTIMIQVDSSQVSTRAKYKTGMSRVSTEVDSRLTSFLFG